MQGTPQASGEPAPEAIHRCHCCAHQYRVKFRTHYCPACGHFYEPIGDPYKLVYSQRFLYEKLCEQSEILQAAWKRLAEKTSKEKT